jgi:hypothetical protein
MTDSFYLDLASLKHARLRCPSAHRARPRSRLTRWHGSATALGNASARPHDRRGSRGATDLTVVEHADLVPVFQEASPCIVGVHGEHGQRPRQLPCVELIVGRWPADNASGYACGRIGLERGNGRASASMDSGNRSIRPSAVRGRTSTS